MRAGYIVLADRYVYTAYARDIVRGSSPTWVRKVWIWLQQGRNWEDNGDQTDHYDNQIGSIPNPANSAIIRDFYEYMKANGTAENYQNQNLKAMIIFFNFLGSDIIVILVISYIPPLKLLADNFSSHHKSLPTPVFSFLLLFLG